jgi:hypothetical protein
MTEQHPITVPAGSITCWRALYRGTYQGDFSETEYIVNEAARWGADQELEACCEWLEAYDYDEVGRQLAELLRAARRPKPKSLKERLTEALYNENIGEALRLVEQLPE